MKKHIFWLLLAIAMFVYGYIEGSGNSRSDTPAPQVHQTANPATSIPSDLVAPARDQARDRRHDQMIELFREMLQLAREDQQNKVAHPTK